MEQLIKNIDHSTPFELMNLVEYEKGKVTSLTFAQKSEVGLTLFAIDEGERLSTHSAPGDAMAIILEGEAEITIDGEVFIAKAGQGIVMPAEIPHSVKAITKFKMFLSVVKKG